MPSRHASLEVPSYDLIQTILNPNDVPPPVSFRQGGYNPRLTVNPNDESQARVTAKK